MFLLDKNIISRSKGLIAPETRRCKMIQKLEDTMNSLVSRTNVWSNKIRLATLGYELARNYYMKDEYYGGKTLKDINMDVFNIEGELAIESFFNRKQKLYIVAEEVSPVVRQVSEHLRDCYKMNINHLEYLVLKIKKGEYLLSIEKVLGFDSIKPNEFKPGVSISQIGWSGSEKVKDVVYKAVLEVTNGNENTTIANKDVIRALLQKYPETNTTTVRCQIIQDCVKHTSRKHYPSGQKDLYFKEGNVYRLYVEERDGKWDWEGNRIQ